jgi:hypothetical protein
MSLGLLLSQEWGLRPAEVLLREVDAALYAAKEAGRNCIKVARPEEATADHIPPPREPAGGAALVVTRSKTHNRLFLGINRFAISLSPVPSSGASRPWIPAHASRATPPAACRCLLYCGTGWDS